METVILYPLPERKFFIYGILKDILGILQKQVVGTFLSDTSGL